MRSEILKYLEDIDFSIARIEFHLQPLNTFAEFKEAWTIYDAVERRLAIIGEAVWQIEKLDKDFTLTDKKKIIGFRHILTHEYDLISPDIIWKIIKNSLPVLKQEVVNYLKK